MRTVLAYHLRFCWALVMGADGVVALDADTKAKSVRFKRLANRNSLLGRRGFPRAGAYPACVRFKFAGRSLGRGTLRCGYSGGSCRRPWEIRGFCAGSRYSSRVSKGGVGGPRRVVGFRPHRFYVDIPLKYVLC